MGDSTDLVILTTTIPEPKMVDTDKDSELQKWIKMIWQYNEYSLAPERFPTHRILLSPQHPVLERSPVHAEYPLHSQALVDIPINTEILSSFESSTIPPFSKSKECTWRKSNVRRHKCVFPWKYRVC
jgi:hypothetical protein